jgi:hypothetical protein
MSEVWQLVIHEPSVRVLLVAPTRNRTILLRALDRLAANPFMEGDFIEKDVSGRSIQVWIVKPWSIAFWLDPFVKEIRIVRIDKIASG